MKFLVQFLCDCFKSKFFLVSFIIFIICSCFLFLCDDSVILHSFNSQSKTFAIRQLSHYETKTHEHRVYIHDLKYHPRSHANIFRKYFNKYLDHHYMRVNEYSEQKGYITKDFINGYLVSSLIYIIVYITYSILVSRMYGCFKDLCFWCKITILFTKQVLTLITICSFILAFGNYLVIYSFEVYGINFLFGVTIISYSILIIQAIVYEYLYFNSKRHSNYSVEVNIDR